MLWHFFYGWNFQSNVCHVDNPSGKFLYWKCRNDRFFSQIKYISSNICTSVWQRISNTWSIVYSYFMYSFHFSWQSNQKCFAHLLLLCWTRTKARVIYTKAMGIHKLRAFILSHLPENPFGSSNMDYNVITWPLSHLL